MARLSRSFYQRPDVVLIAKELLGKFLFTKFGGKLTGGIITETEAYAGVTDRASHAYGGRRTVRTGTLYMQGGTAYVYLSYGIHSLFNVVTNKEEVPQGVLIRAIRPTHGIRTILRRRNMTELKKNAASGPGTVSEALGIHYSQTGTSLLGNRIWIEDRKYPVDESRIVAGKRVGVESAGKDAARPYRFILKM